jgi:SNF2 family DNA or RNA helicase
MCAGTVEERVASLLEQKRELAARVVGSGEQWITELGQNELRELFSLTKTAVVLDDEQREAS